MIKHAQKTSIHVVHAVYIVMSIMHPPLAPGAGCYRYGYHLNISQAPPPRVPVVPKALTRILSHLPEWRAQLQDYPDRAFFGVHSMWAIIPGRVRPHLPVKNMPSVAEHPEVLEDYIRGRCIRAG